MTVFQIVSLSILGVLFVGSAIVAWRGRVARRTAALWAIVWLVTGLAIARPDATTIAAEVMGIARGADLVLYCSVLVMLLGFFLTYTRLRRLEAYVTELTRQLALQQPVTPEQRE